MKTILLIIFLLSGYLCLAAPLQEKGQTVKVVNIDSVYQKQMVEMSGKIQAMEQELDSIGAENRDLLFSRELYSDLISTQLYWFGFFLAVVTLMFGWINFRSVFSKLKEYKKEQDEYKVSVTQMLKNQSNILEEKFNQLITNQKAEFNQELEKQTESIIMANCAAFRGMYFETDRAKAYDYALCWALAVLREMSKKKNHGTDNLENWINNSEKKVTLITDCFMKNNFESINEIIDEILDIIDEKYKERIKLLRENINLKYYSLLEKAKKEKPEN